MTSLHTSRRTTSIAPIDVFAAVNAVGFVVLCVFRYYDRFVHYRGAGHLDEFFVYAGVILASILALWHVFRRYAFHTGMLILLEIGIVMHFAGAFVLVDGGRLYDAHFFGIRFDKYVHMTNAFSAALLMNRLFQIQRIPFTRVNALFLLLVVLGLGAIVEIVEYAVVLTVPNTGVGGYDNNMQDLMANGCGALTFLAARATWSQVRAFGRVAPVGTVSRAP